jgi:hypothetical protein
MYFIDFLSLQCVDFQPVVEKVKETITEYRKYRSATIDSRPQGVKRLVTFKRSTEGDFQLLSIDQCRPDKRFCLKPYTYSDSTTSRPF